MTGVNTISMGMLASVRTVFAHGQTPHSARLSALRLLAAHD